MPCEVRVEYTDCTVTILSLFHNCHTFTKDGILFFYVLLTVRLSIILVISQLNPQILVS